MHGDWCPRCGGLVNEGPVGEGCEWCREGCIDCGAPFPSAAEAALPMWVCDACEELNDAVEDPFDANVLLLPSGELLDVEGLG